MTGLCETYLQLGDGENALRLAERSIELLADADAYVDRGLAKAILAAPDYNGALRDLDRALDIDPRSGRAYRVRSLIHRELGDPGSSAADLAKAKELGFPNEDAGDGPVDAQA